MENNYKKIWIAVAVILIGLLFYFIFKNYYKNTKPTTQKTPVKNEFSKSPFSKYPIETMPKVSATPQYWNNPGGTGGNFTIYKPFSQAVEDYKNQLSADGWVIDTQLVASTTASFSISNKSSGKSGQVNIIGMPDKTIITTRY